MSERKLISFDDATYLFKFCLRSIGILPNNWHGSHLLMIYFIISGLIDTMMFAVDTIVKRSTSVDAIYETLGTLGINLRFYILLAKRRQFTQLMNDCADLWNDYCDVNTQPLVMNFERKIRTLFWLLFASIGIFVNLLYGFNAIYVSYLSDHNANISKILPFRWFGVEDVDSAWPGYKIVFAIQLLVVYNAGIISATVDSALPLLMILCCGYFQVLCEKLKNINDDNSLLADYKLVDCCRFHQRILDLCSNVESLGRLMFLIELSSSGYMLGLIVIKLASSDPDKYKYLPVLCALLTHIFICQWAPDLLMNESKDVSMAVYSSSCTFMKRPSGRHVIIMILRAQQPLIMTAGGIVILSLNNFGKMLSSALSLFTTMRNFVN